MVAVLALLFAACAPANGEPPAATAVVSATAPEPAASEATPDPFDTFLQAAWPVADGFSVPDGTPCGEGCWSWRRPTPVRAAANGMIGAVDGDTIVTRHTWYDDQQKESWGLEWRGVTPSVAVGQAVRRGDVIGTATTLHIEGPPNLGPIDTFLAGRPRLPVPQAEPVLALVSHARKQMRVYREGVAVGTYEVGFGQAEGDKERRGDNKTPKGVYHVVARSTGPFDGPYGAYYGGHWIKLGYPNPWDAARGVDEGLFDADLQREITRAFWARRTPPQGTKLGGGIGLHGWAYEWADEQPRGMSWGCVVLHLRDVDTIYDTLTEGAMVVLF